MFSQCNNNPPAIEFVFIFFDCLLIEKHNVDTSRWIHFLRAISMTTTSGKTKTETKIKYFDDDPYWLDFLFFS